MLDFSPLGLTKLAATFLVGAGAKTIVKEVIRNNITAPESTFDKVKIGAATVVLSAVVAKAAKKHTDEMITGVATYVSATFKAMQDGDDILSKLLHTDATGDETVGSTIPPIVEDKQPATATTSN